MLYEDILGYMVNNNLKDSISWILGGRGICIKREFVKKVMRRLASRLDGTSTKDSSVVKSKWSRLICKRFINKRITNCSKIECI
jgi:hypothetical protein